MTPNHTRQWVMLCGWGGNHGPDGKQWHHSPTTRYKTNITCQLTAHRPGSDLDKTLCWWLGRYRTLCLYWLLYIYLTFQKQDCLKSTDPAVRHLILLISTPNIATEPKCKLLLAKSHKSIHKNFGAQCSSIFRVIMLTMKVVYNTHMWTYVHTYGTARHYIPTLPTGNGDNYGCFEF